MSYWAVTSFLLPKNNSSKNIWLISINATPPATEYEIDNYIKRYEHEHDISYNDPFYRKASVKVTRWAGGRAPSVTNQIEDVIISLRPIEVACNDEDTTLFLQNLINFLSRKFSRLKNVYLLYQGAFFNKKELVYHNVKVIPIFFPYYLFLSCNVIKYPETNSTLKIKEWTTGNKKALYTVGSVMPSYRHKLELIYEFLHNKFDRLDYTLKPNYWWGIPDCDQIKPWYNMDYFIRYFKKYFDIEIKEETFLDFINSISNLFDSDPLFNKKGDPCKCKYLPFVYSYPIEWNDAALVIQMESSIYRPVDKQFWHEDDKNVYEFSEKIWKPLLSKKPFITYSEKDLIYKNLQDMGFKTFLEYTSEPEFITDTIPDIRGDEYTFDSTSAIIKKHCEVTFNRTKSFLDNMEKYEENIRADVEHNYLNYQNLVKKEWKRVCTECPLMIEYDMDDFCHLLSGHTYNMPDSKI